MGEYLREEDSLYATPAAPGVAPSGPTHVSEVEGDNGLVRKPQRRPRPAQPASAGARKGAGGKAGGGAKGGRGGAGPKAKRARKA